MSNIVYGDKNVAVPHHVHFGKYLLENLKKEKSNIALINAENGEKLTYKEFTQYAVNLANKLMKLGIGRGDVVAVGSEKRNYLGPTLVAILLTGAAYTAYDLQTGKSALAHKLTVAQPNYFIMSESFWERYSKLLLSFDAIKSFFTLDIEPKSAISIQLLVKDDIDIDTFEPAEVDGENDVAIILYSSGTTGLPKGVLLTHLNSIVNVVPYSLDLNVINTIYTCGEWYHNYDTFSAYKFLCLGKTVVYLCDVTSEKILKCIDQYKINMAMLIPYFIVGLGKVLDSKKYNLDSLKIIYSRSAPLHNKTIENIKQRFPGVQEIFQGYGMTECGELSSEIWGTKGAKPGSVGMASPGLVLKISDPKTGKTLGPNERGEIRSSGRVLMNGYIRIDRDTYLDEDGFLKTGDLGYYDEDKYFYIVDRIKDILCYNGDQVPPLELETILELHPGVLEAAVVGKDDEVHGDIPTAFVVRQADSNVTEEELINYVAAEVPPFMHLAGGVKFITKLPRNPRGKILRRELKNLLNK
ncbi:unnamed protein product [Leptosia nina]|uniref:Uncharacterized protein n=1 Tax=Leptosia nina TaxID=320188 RepID=A0AAV1J4M9_9NEOP